MCENDGLTKRELDEVLDRLRGQVSVVHKGEADAARVRQNAFGIVKELAGCGNPNNMTAYQLTAAIFTCDFFIGTYKKSCLAVDGWIRLKEVFEDTSKKLREAVNLPLEPNLRDAVNFSCGPKFLILMMDDNTVIQHPLIEIKEGVDMKKVVDAAIQDLIVDDNSDIDAELAGLLKVVEVQFVANHFIHTKFVVTGF